MLRFSLGEESTTQCSQEMPRFDKASRDLKVAANPEGSLWVMVMIERLISKLTTKICFVRGDTKERLTMGHSHDRHFGADFFERGNQPKLRFRIEICGGLV